MDSRIITALGHSAAAIALLVAGHALGLGLAFGVGASLVWFMREVTQAEYNWIRDNGGLRSAMPVLQGTKFWLWPRHMLLGGLVPTALVVIIAILWG